MKVMWICNILLPEFAQEIKQPIVAGGSWMVALSKDMIHQENLKLVICAPYSGNNIENRIINKIDYFAVPTENMSDNWKEIVERVKPDIIHIHGTEFEHAYVLLKACPNEKYVVSIQGLTSIYAKHYLANLPYKVTKAYSFKDFIKGENILKTQKQWEKRGLIEQKIIRSVDNVIGRTTWDKACTKIINPKTKYHYCSESLRDSFYENEWSYDACEKKSIFISQGTYPIKGLHMVIEPLAELIKDFPDLKVYIAGNNICDNSTIMKRLKRGYYGIYLKNYIRKYNLQDNIEFLGPLTEKDMCERLKKSHVFLSASSIENSPNSVGEAMSLGVPCVSSNVGGVSDMIKDKEEGFLYPFNENYMITYYISEIFNNKEIALTLSKNSRAKAKVLFDRNRNVENNIKIYNEIINCKK